MAKIARILANHGINTKWDGTRLLALEIYTCTDADGNICLGEQWIDVTNFTAKQVYAWLGY